MDSPLSVKRPSSTIMIEMTMATVGRRMKKFAISALRHGRGRRYSFLERDQLRRHLGAAANLLDALDHDAFARFQPRIDHHQPADALAWFDGSDLHGVVRANDGDVTDPLDLLNGALCH